MKNWMCVQMNWKFQFACVMHEEFDNFVWFINFMIKFFEKFLIEKTWMLKLISSPILSIEKNVFVLLAYFFFYKLGVCYLIDFLFVIWSFCPQVRLRFFIIIVFGLLIDCYFECGILFRLKHWTCKWQKKSQLVMKIETWSLSKNFALTNYSH